MARVLVIDDDPDLVVLLDLQLRALGHEVRARRSLADGLLAAVEERPDVLLLDVDLGNGRTGDELLALLDRGVGRPRVTCLVSGTERARLEQLAERTGSWWLPKPIDPTALAQVVAVADAPAGSRCT